MAAAGLLGTLAGAAFGMILSGLSALLSSAGRQVSIGVALDLGVMGGLVGSLFAAGLIIYARIMGEADTRVATLLGFGAGVIALPLVVLLRDLAVSNWGAAYWFAMLFVAGCWSAWVGRVAWLASGVASDQDGGTPTESLRHSSPLDELPFLEDDLKRRDASPPTPPPAPASGRR